MGRRRRLVHQPDRILGGVSVATVFLALALFLRQEGAVAAVDPARWLRLRAAGEPHHAARADRVRAASGRGAVDVASRKRKRADAALSLVFRAQHHLGLRHDGGLAVAARDSRLQHDSGSGRRGAERIRACATSPIGMPAKKLVLLSIVVVRWPSRRLAFAVVPPRLSAIRHQGAAMHHAVASSLNSSRTASSRRHALGFDLDDLDAEEFGKGRLRDGGLDGHARSSTWRTRKRRGVCRASHSDRPVVRSTAAAARCGYRASAPSSPADRSSSRPRRRPSPR